MPEMIRRLSRGLGLRYGIVLAAAFVIALLALAFSHLSAPAAAPSIGPVSATPSRITAGVPAVVRVTARIEDATVIASTVNLQRLNDAGAVVAVLGVLHDDGANGDAVAGDGIYTLDASFTESAGPVRLRVSAGFRGLLRRLNSEEIVLAVNRRPVANAGRDQETGVGVVATVDGRASSDPDGDLITYLWSFEERPAGSAAALSDPAAVRPSFDVDRPGVYRLKLVVHDGLAASAPSTVTVTATTANVPPTADAGPDQSVPVGASVTLDGRASDDPEGEVLTYAWEFVSLPAGSRARLEDATTATPRFVADVAGSYTLRLIVNDGRAASTPDDVIVAAFSGNTPPTARAVAEPVVGTGSTVLLDGSGSSDPDPGDRIASFAWKFVSLPSGSAATLVDAATANASFVADRAGDYLLELVVTDTRGARGFARVVVSARSETNPVPVLDAIAPAEARVGSPGITIELSGSRFARLASVYFGGSELLTHFVSTTRLRATVPAAQLATARDVGVTVRNPAPGGGTSAALTFAVLPLAPVVVAVDPTTLEVGRAATLTVTGSNFLATSQVLFGATSLATTFHASTRLTAAVPAALLTVPGVVPVSVLDPRAGLSNSVNVTVASGLEISAISPTRGDVGALVTITGRGFEPTPAGNAVSFRAIGAATVAAAVLSATSTQLTVRVPALADSGPITLTIAARGTALSPPFTVTREQDYQLVASPAEISVPQGASGAVQLQIASTGSRTFTGLATLTALGLPAGVVASFAPDATLSAFHTGTLTLTAASTAVPGRHTVTIQAAATEAGQPFVRSAQVNLTVQSAAGLTGLKGRFVTPDYQGIAGIVVRADISVTPQPQTTTDAAGNFTLLGLPPGALTLRFDATPAHPLYPIWPLTVNLTASQVLALADLTINPPPPDERFTAISNATNDQVISDERYPGLAIKLPAGVTITGWDGVLKSRIAVERIMPDKLPVPAPPFPIAETYQMYFGTPMGGIPSAPIPVTLPNVSGREPGEESEIWYFDGSPMGGTGEWRLAGMGTISPDGRTVVSNPGVGIPRFCGVCGLLCIKGDPPQQGSGCGSTDNLNEGNPIDTFSGLTLPKTGGLRCGGLTPIETGLSYHPVDSFNNRAGTVGSFGYGWISDYDVVFLPFAGPQKRLVMPGSVWVNFVDETYDAPAFSASRPISPTAAGAVYRPFDDPRFDGAGIVATNASANEWELQFKDGRIWRFKPFPGITGVIRGGPPLFVTEMVNAAGNVVSISRQPNGRITAVGSPGRNALMSYGANGFVSEVRDSADRVMRYTYTADDRIETITDADGKVTRYTYVGDDEVPQDAVCGEQPSLGRRLKAILYPGRPSPTENFHGSSRRVLRQTGYDGREFKFAYKATGACVTNVATPGVKCRSGCPDTDSWENHLAGWRFHGGRVISTTVTLPDGTQKSHAFNPKGRPLESRLQLGRRIVATYDTFNRRTQRTDELSRTWRYRHDGRGNLTQLIDPLGRRTDYTYDGRWNKPTSIVRYLDDGTPVVIQVAYDTGTGNPIRVIDPLGNITNLGYTAQGQLNAVTVPGGRTATFGYNAFGDLGRAADPLGNATSFETDAVGRPVKVTDPLGFDSRAEYNAVDQVTKFIDALRQEIRYTYDPAQRLASVVDSRAVTIESYDYDGGDRLTARTDAVGQTSNHEYDASGRLVRFTDRKGQVMTYAYDAAGRITRLNYPDHTQTRIYDAAGRLAEIRESASAVSYAYDLANRVVREVTESTAGRHEVAYGYDTLDRVVRRTVDGGDPTAYAYDRASRLTSIQFRGQSTTYEWDAAGRLLRKTLPNGIRQDQAYDDADRLLSIGYTKPDGSVVEAIGYTYDAAGRRISKSLTKSDVPETLFTATYDSANRMTSITFTPSGETCTIEHDTNGNMNAKRCPSETTTYTWDSRDRLIGIASPTVNANFKYDALGRRIERTVNGTVTAYVYDGVQAIAETKGGVNTVLLAGIAIDEMISRYSSSGMRVYLTDALGSVIANTVDSGETTSTYWYSPYGEGSSADPDEAESIQYTARENDRTGLYYYRARYYHPTTKRFLFEDPIGLLGGLGLHQYVSGDPVNRSDPTGNFGVGTTVVVSSIPLSEDEVCIGPPATIPKCPDPPGIYCFYGSYGVWCRIVTPSCIYCNPDTQECRQRDTGPQPPDTCMGKWIRVGGRLICTDDAELPGWTRDDIESDGPKLYPLKRPIGTIGRKTGRFRSWGAK